MTSTSIDQNRFIVCLEERAKSKYSSCMSKRLRKQLRFFRRYLLTYLLTLTIKLQSIQGRQLNETRNKLCPVRLVRHKFHLNLYNYSHTKVSEPILGGGGGWGLGAWYSGHVWVVPLK